MPDRGSTYNHIPLPVTSGGLTFQFTFTVQNRDLARAEISLLNLCRALAISQSKAMCGLTSQVLARDFKAGGHPDLISAAKLLQRFLALDFAVIYFSLLHSHYARLQRIMDGKYFLARRRSDFCFSAKRYARDEHSALRQRLCVMMISDINISYPAYLTSIIPPYI